MANDPNLEQQALAKLNADRSWVMANKAWLIAMLAALIVGVILGKLV